VEELDHERREAGDVRAVASGKRPERAVGGFCPIRGLA
jgi:hypothetical protein